MSPLLIALSMLAASWGWVPSSQCAVTSLPACRTSGLGVAFMVWAPPSTRVIDLTWPSWMYWFIWLVGISSYPPGEAMYCRANRMSSTATTIHGHGLRAKRFTGLSRGRHCCSPAPADEHWISENDDGTR